MRSSGLVELDAVLAVARRRGFRAAALELGVSRTSLSSAVAALETRLGVRLFHRTTRSVSLTEAGERFVAAIEPALASIQGAMEDVTAHREEPSGTLRLNSSLGAAQRVLTPIVVGYLRRHPAMKVDLVTEGRFIDIVREGFDAGIRNSVNVPKDMVSVSLGMPVRFAVVGAPALFRGRALPKKPADLAAYRCIGMRESSGQIYRWEFARRGRKAYVSVEGGLTLDAPLLVREAALAGVGVAYLAEWSVSDDVKAGRLVRVLEDWTPQEGGLALYYPGHRHVPASVRAFVEVIRDVTRKKR